MLQAGWKELSWSERERIKARVADAQTIAFGSCLRAAFESGRVTHDLPDTVEELQQLGVVGEVRLRFHDDPHPLEG